MQYDVHVYRIQLCDSPYQVFLFLHSANALVWLAYLTDTSV